MWSRDIASNFKTGPGKKYCLSSEIGGLQDKNPWIFMIFHKGGVLWCTTPLYNLTALYHHLSYLKFSKDNIQSVVLFTAEKGIDHDILEISMWLNIYRIPNQVLALHTTVNSGFLVMDIASRCNVYHYKYPELKLQHRASRNGKSLDWWVNGF